MSIKNGLIEEFNSQLEEVSKLEVGTEKYKIAVEGLTKLADRIIEIEKLEQIESENGVKWEAQNWENDLKALQMKDEKHDRMIRNVIEGIKVGGGLTLTAIAFVASMNFEKNGNMFSYEGSRAVLRSLLKFNNK